MSILSYLQDTKGCILYLLSKILFESIFPTPAKQDLDAPFGAIEFFNNRHAKNMAQSCTMYGATFYF